jgi:putative SOS response-associated peptidase YedK
MCGRFVSSTPPDQLARYFGAEAPPAERLQEANYNVAPTQAIYTVYESDGTRKLDTFHWGLVPFWAKDPKIGNRMINARAETLAEKNAYKSPFKKRRCIIPADGFYEWEPKEAGRTPHWVFRADGYPMAFAGIWSTWKDPSTGELVRTCAIITTKAEGSIGKIHARMPVILDPSVWDAWLDRDLTDASEAERLLQPVPSDLLMERAVSTRVNNVRNDGPELIEPATEDG